MYFGQSFGQPETVIHCLLVMRPNCGTRYGTPLGCSSNCARPVQYEESSLMKRIAILGSTGSIGRSTLSVVEGYPDRFQIATLAAGNNADLAFEQAVRWKPRVVSLATEQSSEMLRTKLRSAGLAEIEVVHGAAGTVRVATHREVDFVVSAIVGVSGLEATYEAVRAGKTVGLANKE